MGLTGEALHVRILAAIDHAEKLAQAVAQDTEPEWSPGHEHLSDYVSTAEYGSAVTCGLYGYMGWELRQYIALNDPRSTLRRCAADRRTMQRHQQQTIETSRWDPKPIICGYCSHVPDAVDWPCLDVVDLADRYGCNIEEDADVQ